MTNVPLTDLGLSIPPKFFFKILRILKCISTSVNSTIYWQYTFETFHLPTVFELQQDHAGGGGEGGDSLIKVGTDLRAQALGFSGVNFCPGISFW